MNNYRFEDIYIGLHHEFKVNITEKMIDAFREICADYNPLHNDREFAASYGFSDKVVYGMLTASFLSTLVGVYLPGRYALFQELNVSFTSPVYPGDYLTINGDVISIHEAYKQVELKINIYNQNGVKVSRGKIRVGLNE